ncbi:transposase [Spiribacter vilamensis]|uniref:transposase n=1 Tax=Spiribacter vilamensis TaxID=531306 RepID=UPI0013EE73C8
MSRQLRWSEIIPLFAFWPGVRKIIYTANAIESLNSQVREAVLNKRHFWSDEAAIKLIYLALRTVQTRWNRSPVQ